MVRTNTSRRRRVSYYAYLKDLNRLLVSSKIIPGRLPIRDEKTGKKRTGQIASELLSHDIIGSVILYVDHHIGEPMSLDQLAKEAGISKYQLIRIFRSETGITPWKLVQERRLEKARELLEAGMPPAQVAAESGFYDQSHMGHVFQQELGMSPGEYQEKNFMNRN